MANPIIYVAPLFFVLVLAELAIGWKRARQTYVLGDSLTSIGLGMSTQIFNIFTRPLNVGIYFLIYQHLSFFKLPADQWWVWAIGIIGYDFFYYWSHRYGHEINVLWASHVVHHSSEQYNYATAMRQSSTGFLSYMLFFWPLALIGVPPVVFVTSALISLAYQFWIHTCHIGSLGWFDRWFASPSNHRVHHGQNDYCIDKNYGAILMLWDRLFNTFEPERKDEEVVFGIQGQLGSLDPVTANLHKYAELLRDSKAATNWKDRLRVWIAAPGWRPAEAERLHPAKPHDLSQFRYYRPRISKSTGIYALLQATLVIGVGTFFTAFSSQLPKEMLWLGAAWLLASLWVIGRTLDARRGQAVWQALWLLSLAMPLALVHQHFGPAAQGWLLGAALVALLLLGLLPQMRKPLAREQA